MKKSNIPVLILISVIILIFTVSMLLSGCGRRARIARALQDQESASVEEQSIEEATTIEEATELDTSDDEKDVSVEETTEAGETVEESEESEEESVEEETEEETTEETTENVAEVLTAEIPVVVSESGSIVKGSDVYPGSEVGVGDYENKALRGYVSFKIIDFVGATIKTAKINLDLTEKFGKPLEFKDSICIEVISWGTREIKLGDYAKSGPLIGCYEAANIGKSPEVLKSELQETIDEGKKRFQICIYGTGPDTDNDNEDDAFAYMISETGGAIRITITYTME